MDIFFEILHNLTELDLILNIDKKLNRLDIRSVRLYSVSEKNNEIIVSQTKPPLSRYMIGDKIEASFIASIHNNEPERFFFMAKIIDIKLFPLTRYRLEEVIFLEAIEKKIYKGSLRVYPRFKCDKDFPVYVRIGYEDEKFSVKDISEGGLCFICPKNMLNSIRFTSHKKLDIRIEFPDNIVEAKAEVVRRFEVDDFPDMQHVAIKFLDIYKDEQEKLKNILMKLKEKKQ